ncbi:restriction endonuclease [Actimicrobium antarcticum]|uniref:Restriction endonuclease type IV Mrr domain-containing protein n=1 Tax=Actimicrobium antarcticum TaxID=1051899 RepID=A0ABP7TM81_9BURK
MFQRRSGNTLFFIVTVLMILLGMGNGLLGIILDKVFPALEPDDIAEIAPALLVLWLVTLMIWAALLVARLRRKWPRRRSARLRKRVSPRQPMESTMQGQWKQTGMNRAWTEGNNDTRERIDRTMSKSVDKQNAVTASTPALSRPLDFDGLNAISPDIALARPSVWSLGLLQELEWHRFDQVCANFLETLGLEAKALAQGPDSQVSLQIGQPGVGQMHAIAKTQAGAATVEVERIRMLVRTQTGYQLDKAFFLSASSFSPQALAAGRDAHLVLIDGMAMLAQIQAMPPAPREALLSLATRGDYRTPTCPACASKMVMCSGDFKSFWRCSEYPTCRSRLTLAGDSTLPQ